MGWHKLTSCVQSSFLPLLRGKRNSLEKGEVCMEGKEGGGLIVKVGVGREGGTTVKNVNLLITEYIAVHLQCCCHANTLGVYFLNPREELSVPCSPAVPFEFAAATAATVVSVLENGVGGGVGGSGGGGGGGLGSTTKAVRCKAARGLSRRDLVKMTQINILYLNQTKINGSLSVQLSPTVTRQAFVGQNQH